MLVFPGSHTSHKFAPQWLVYLPFSHVYSLILWQNDLVEQQSNSRNLDGVNTCPLDTVYRRIYQIRHCGGSGHGLLRPSIA